MAGTRKTASKSKAAKAPKRAAASKRSTAKTKDRSAGKRAAGNTKKKVGQPAESKNLKLLPKFPTSITLRERFSVVALSPYRFPLDIDRLAIQTARVAGIAFVLVGAIFTYISANDMTADLAAYTVGVPQLAQTYSAVSVYDQSDSATSLSLPRLTVNFEVSAPNNNGDRTVSIDTNHETYSAELYATNMDTGNVKRVAKMSHSGTSGNQVTWTALWSTDEFPAGTYRLSANFVESALAGLINDRYVLTDTNTYTLKDTDHGDNETEIKNEGEDSSSSAIDSGVEVSTPQEDETQAGSLSEETDSVDHDDDNDNSDESDEPTITKKKVESSDAEKLLQDTEISDPNKLKFRSLGRSEVSGYIRVSLETNFDPEKIEIYAAAKNSTSPRFLGQARSAAEDLWVFDWNTTNSPNGEYELFAKANMNGVRISSDHIKLRVVNERTVSTDGDDPVRIVEVFESSEISETKRIVDGVKAEIEAETENRPAQPEPESVALALLQEYRVDINEAGQRLATAIRSGDPSAIDQATEHFDKLKRSMLRNSVTTGTDVFIAKTEEQLDRLLSDVEDRVEHTERIVRERVGEEISRDTDKDGVSDYDEVTIYNTDPTSADTDNDGFNDGAEIISGFDPTDGSAEAVVEYESPKEKGLVRKDILEVREINTLVINKSATQNNTGSDVSSDVAKKGAPQLLVSGKALPNSFVTLYVYSSPIIVTVRTNSDGAWSYQFDKELEDGEHEVYVGLTDNTGKLVAKSEPFKFVKTAEAYTAVALATDDTAVRADGGLALFGEGILMLLLSISVLIIGLILLLLGFHLKARGEHLIAEGYVPNQAT